MYEPSIQLRYYKGSYKQVGHHEMKCNWIYQGRSRPNRKLSPSFSVLKEERFSIILKNSALGPNILFHT